MALDKPKPPRKPPAAKKYPPRRPPQRLIKIAQKLLAPALALVVVLGTAAAGSGDADYELILPGIGGEPICAKSKADCQAAVDAIHRGRWLPEYADQLVSCKPHPGCFPESSNHIRGFN